MGTGAITQYVDVAQLVLYAFWIFFAGLIYYLVRENHREGYPMDHDGPNLITGWPTPAPKTYKVGHGEEVVIPNLAPPTQTIHSEPAYGWAGAPIVPTGNPLVAGVGPGAWAERADRPDVDFEGHPKLSPLRKSADFGVAPNDTDPRGLTVYGGDDQPAGKVVDLWADVSETLFRYLEVELPDRSRTVLVPWNFAKVKGKTRTADARVDVNALFASQFNGVPALRQPDVVTLLEEEKIMAYFGAGTLYADPSRAEPLL